MIISALALLTACSGSSNSHEHVYNDPDCENAAVCTICGEEIEPALGHTTEIGACARCGKVQNEKLLETLNEGFAVIMDAGNKMMGFVTNVSTQNIEDQYTSFLDADVYASEMKAKYNELIDACGNYEELAFMKYQLQVLNDANPAPITGNDEASIANQTVQYQLYLNQISSSFNYLSNEMDYLAGNGGEPGKVLYFDEVEEMPTPDSVIYGISFDNKSEQPGNIQYLYLIGPDENTAIMNYNNYLNILRNTDGLDVVLQDNYSIVNRNGTMVSAMMAGTDPKKGYFLMVTFQG